MSVAVRGKVLRHRRHLAEMRQWHRRAATSELTMEKKQLCIEGAAAYGLRVLSQQWLPWRPAIVSEGGGSDMKDQIITRVFGSAPSLATLRARLENFHQRSQGYAPEQNPQRDSAIRTAPIR